MRKEETWEGIKLTVKVIILTVSACSAIANMVCKYKD
jgi:hypothetical protein